ncbi:MAG: hypothetical protein ACOYT8_00335 [Candidatus Dependentiae bacterium]
MKQGKRLLLYVLVIGYPVSFLAQTDQERVPTTLEKLHAILNIDNPSLKDGIVGLWHEIAGQPPRTTATEIKQLINQSSQEHAQNLATTMAELDRQFTFARNRVINAKYEDQYDREKLQNELASLLEILSQVSSAFGNMEKLVQEFARAAHALEQRALSEQELKQYTLAVVDLKEALAQVISQYQQERARIDDQVAHLLDNYGRNNNVVKDYWKQIEQESAQSLKRLKNAVTTNMSQLELLMAHIRRLSEYLGHPVPEEN